MRILDISEAAARISTLLDEVQYEPLAIERDGKNVAFLVSASEYEADRQEKKRDFFAAWNILSSEIEEKAARGEIDLDDLLKSLDRKAS